MEDLKKIIETELEKALQEKAELEKRLWFTCNANSTKKQWYKVHERIRILKKLLMASCSDGGKGK